MADQRLDRGEKVIIVGWHRQKTAVQGLVRNRLL